MLKFFSWLKQIGIIYPVMAFVPFIIFLMVACSTPTVAPTTAPAAVPVTAKPTDAPPVAPAADAKAGWPTKFVLGLFAGDDPNKVLGPYDSLRAYLETKLGVKFELVTGTSYTAVIEAMRAKKADGMMVGPFSYTLAVQEANAEALVVADNGNVKDPKYDPQVTPYYYSVIITKKGSGITKIADLKGKDFSFVDPASTSGHLMPKTLILKNGINPDKDMKTIFAGSHPTSVQAVWNDKVPAGATYEGNLYQMNQQDQIKLCFFKDDTINKARTADEIKSVYDACPTGNLAIIAYSDPIPNTPFAVRQDLPQSFKDALKAALLDVKNQPALVAKINEWYVDPTQDLGLKNLDAFFNPLRDIAKLLDLDLKAMK